MNINSFRRIKNAWYNRWAQQCGDAIFEFNIVSCDCGMLKANATIPAEHETGSALQIQVQRPGEAKTTDNEK